MELDINRKRLEDLVQKCDKFIDEALKDKMDKTETAGLKGALLQKVLENFTPGSVKHALYEQME